MTLQESTDFFSKPRHKDLILIFEAIDDTHILINDEATTLNNGYNFFSIPDDVAPFATEIVFTFTRHTRNETQTINVSKSVDDLGTYNGYGILNATRLDIYSEGGKIMRLWCGISENRDILCLLVDSSDPHGMYYDISYLSAWMQQDEFVLDNENIVKESLSIESSLCASDEELHFGRCEATSLSLTIALDTDIKIKNRWFRAQLMVDAPDTYLVDNDGNRIVDSDGNYIVSYKNGNVEPFELGRFKVFSDKPRNDRITRDIVCYDIFYDINNTNVRPWLDSLSLPMNLKNIRDSFFNYLGITQVETELINDGITFGSLQVGDEAIVSGQSVIESICESNGAFGRINDDGEFEYYYINPNLPVEYPFYVDDSGAYEDYVTDFITGIQSFNADGSIRSSVGSSINAYKIQNNLFPVGSLGLNRLFDLMRGISYRPFNISTFGNPVLPVGTWVTFNTKNKTITSLVMSKTLNGIQSMRDNIEAYGEKRLRELEL